MKQRPRIKKFKDFRCYSCGKTIVRGVLVKTYTDESVVKVCQKQDCVSTTETML